MLEIALFTLGARFRHVSCLVGPGFAEHAGININWKNSSALIGSRLLSIRVQTMKMTYM